jgi:hypothetical protein
MEKKGTSWGWIIFWFIIFWPIGLFLLIKKLTTDRSATMGGNFVVSVLGWLLIAFGAFFAVSVLPHATKNISSAIIFTILWIVGGIALVKKGRTIKQDGIKYKKYIDLVVNHRVTAMDNLVSAVGLQYETVKSDLQTMIEKGYFSNAYINEGKREIVLATHQSVPVPSSPGAAPVSKYVATCKSCGANNTVVDGRENSCEYCGSPL